ncbi:MAG TPA: hypothetical protein VGG72_30465 [Bryobacteraceae bacterium]|jgi:hypothetical protein
MKTGSRIFTCSATLLFGLAFLWACPFDDTLRAYLDGHFWLPFSRHSESFEKKGIRRISAPFAGMVKSKGFQPLETLRAAYQEIPVPQPYQPVAPAPYDFAKPRRALAAARTDPSLSRRDREEVDLVDAKIDMREGQPDQPASLLSAKKKLEQFLKVARTPELLSEARGWLAHVDYALGDQTAAGKIYLDELNRNGSNLSRETLLTSLKMTYGYDGGQKLLDHLDEYFDTPEHAAFAIQLVTNPHWDDYGRNGYERQYTRRDPRPDRAAQSYARIQRLLALHTDLLASQTGADALALLTMRTALRMGDPPGVLKIAEMIPTGDAIRSEPDFEWMLASAHFISHEYAAAEQPLLDLFKSPRASAGQKAAAAYGLCGVYRKLDNPVEQIRFALYSPQGDRGAYPSDGNEDMSVYFAESGWDFSLLLDAEAPTEALKAFVDKYPDMPGTHLVKYALAVRLARVNRYEESAQLYDSLRETASRQKPADRSQAYELGAETASAIRRAPRMRQLATLYEEANRSDVSSEQLQTARYKLADFIRSHPDQIYFNDHLWSGVQRYALYANTDDRLTGEERQSEIDAERKLKDDQEERWRAYLILRDVIRDAGKTELGRKAAELAVLCVRRIARDRFGRQDELARADVDLSKWLAQK